MIFHTCGIGIFLLCSGRLFPIRNYIIVMHIFYQRLELNAKTLAQKDMRNKILNVVNYYCIIKEVSRDFFFPIMSKGPYVITNIKFSWHIWAINDYVNLKNIVLVFFMFWASGSTYTCKEMDILVSRTEHVPNHIFALRYCFYNDFMVIEVP